LAPVFHSVANSEKASPDTLFHSEKRKSLQAGRQSEMEGTKVMRSRFNALNGVTVFSTDPAQIGANKSSKPAVSCSAGRTYNHGLSSETEDVLEGMVTHLDIIETYLPVFDEQKRIVAVFEIYSDVKTWIALLTTPPDCNCNSCWLLGLLFVLLYVFGARADDIDGQKW